MKISHKHFLKYFFPFLLFLFSFRGNSLPPELKNGWWKAVLERGDGQQVVFNFRTADSNGKKVLYIMNAEEQLVVDSIRQKGDSVFIQLPFFESFFKARINSRNNLEGVWIKRTADADQVMPFKAYYNVKERFKAAKPSKYNISGRWDVNFKKADGRERKAVGEFVQKGKVVTGTFLTASGDYRYLQGVVTGDTLQLSAFDGSHAFSFIANVTSNNTITNGSFYAGAIGAETWKASKNAAAALPDGYDITRMREGETALAFAFKSLDGDTVSIKDSAYRNKVVIVQLMGSWCPNCMDETRFLSDYYKANRNKGLEIIAIAYENTTDFERAKTSIQRFQKRFDVQYPMLVSGVTVSDPLRTEKTLPQLQEIKAFPTTIFIDKKGKVRKIHSGFNGPGTGAHYEAFKKEFDAIIQTLTNEN